MSDFETFFVIGLALGLGLGLSLAATLGVVWFAAVYWENEIKRRRALWGRRRG